jgi:formylglycine-generating enzyme required for sulfatase activity
VRVAFGLLMVASLAGGACLVEIKPLASGTGGAGQGGNAAGGATSTGGSGAGGASATCPSDMVHATHPNYPDVSFCIDKTETTQSQYIAFLSSVSGEVSQTEQPMECDFNMALTRTNAGANCPNWSSGGDIAVNCVDWCDAYAYCAWGGKRLCGDFEGGPLAKDASVTNDEWQFACTAGFEQAYPYGDSGVLCACYIAEEWMTQDACGWVQGTNLNLKIEVASLPGCEGGFPGVFDMQGNAAEWTNRCDPGSGMGTELCATRGGHTYSVAGSTYYSCDNLAQETARNDPALDTGIRCCKDAGGG